MTRKQFHPKRRKKTTAGEDTVARGTAAIFLTAAARVLQREHGWEPAAISAFGERVTAVAMEVAYETLGAARAAVSPLSGTAAGEGDVTGKFPPAAVAADMAAAAPAGEVAILRVPEAELRRTTGEDLYTLPQD